MRSYQSECESCQAWETVKFLFFVFWTNHSISEIFFFSEVPWKNVASIHLRSEQGSESCHVARLYTWLSIFKICWAKAGRNLADIRKLSCTFVCCVEYFFFCFAIEWICVCPYYREFAPFLNCVSVPWFPFLQLQNSSLDFPPNDLSAKTFPGGKSLPGPQDVSDNVSFLMCSFLVACLSWNMSIWMSSWKCGR